MDLALTCSSFSRNAMLSGKEKINKKKEPFITRLRPQTSDKLTDQFDVQKHLISNHSREDLRTTRSPRHVARTYSYESMPRIVEM